MDSIELLPCPFCGGKAEEQRDCAGIYNYFCSKCECAMYGDYTHHATGQKAWNSRIHKSEKELCKTCLQEVVQDMLTSETGLEAAFARWLTTLPVGAQINIRDAAERDESLTWRGFRHAFLSALSILNDVVGKNNA